MPGPLGRMIVAASVLAWGGSAWAQADAVAAVNAVYFSEPSDNRSEAVILPAVARMTPPPPGAGSVDEAILLFTGSRGWPAAERWAQADPQRAVIDAIGTVTADDDPRTAMVFSQAYGVEGVPIDLVRAGLYTELGDPPLLAAAEFGFLRGLEHVSCLVHVEATRRAAAGDPRGAISLLVDWVYFARQIADRQFSTEVRWAMRTMAAALGRVRDIAYEDSRRSSPLLTPADYRTVLTRLAEPRGFLRIGTIPFPEGDLRGARQVIDAAFVRYRGVDQAGFARTLSRLGSTERPLRLFSERARWAQAGALHADWTETTTQADGVFADVRDRWRREWFDPLVSETFAWEKLDPARSAAVLALYRRDGHRLSDLLFERQHLRTEAAGTRVALALQAYRQEHGTFAPSVAAVRPAYLQVVDDDPLNPGRARGAQPFFEYFVPWTVGYRELARGEQPVPHSMLIVAGEEHAFTARIDAAQFVLYSLGPNGEKEWCRRVENSTRPGVAGDYLLWPPVVSLLRSHLRQEGVLR